MTSTKNSNRSRKKYIWVTIALLPIIAAAIYIVPIIQTNKRPLTETIVPQKTLSLHPEIIYPLKNYQRRGDRYKWGKNDCSTFVTDYLLASGKPAIKRLTTEDLYRNGTMDWHGYRLTKISGLKPKDIIVFRYRGKRNTMEGHTGIVLSTGKENIVVHNSLSGGGVVKNTLPEFLAIANRVAGTHNGQKMIKGFTPK